MNEKEKLKEESPTEQEEKSEEDVEEDDFFDSPLEIGPETALMW